MSVKPPLVERVKKRIRAPVFAVPLLVRCACLCALSLLGLVACPSDDDDDVPIDLSGPCELDSLAGRFRVERQEQFPVIDGSVANGVVPVTILEELEVVGPCKLLRRNNPFCDPACEPNFTCDFDGSCIPFPENQDVGTVTITGLAELLEMEPVEPVNRYYDTSLSDPLFQPEDEIVLEAAGEALDGFRLEGIGSDVLELAEDATILVEEGEIILVEWPAPTTEVPATIELELTIDQHGNSPVRIQCELEDTGAAELPAEVADALLNAGVSGFPNAVLSRRTVDSTSAGGLCVELVVGSPRSPDVRVGGHTPCDEPDDCPDGLTCDLAINTCI